MTIQPTQRVKVLRAFYFDRCLQKVGTDLTMPKNFAAEMRAAHKVEFIEPPPPKNPDSKQPWPDNGKGADGGSKTKEEKK